MTVPVSIVIPTRNAGERLDAVLDAIAGQRGAVPCRIIAMDSGSSDGTVERLRRRGAEVIPVDARTFNHGETRNQGLSRAAGELVVLLVQDAVPASRDWLQALLEPMLKDEEVAGSFARQLPAAGASGLTRRQLAGWGASPEEPRVSGPFTPEAFARLSPAERHVVSTFDNVCACVRLRVWRERPFRRTPIAEDLEWGRDVLQAGYKLAYAPRAAVWHSHERPVLYELQRTYLVHERLQALFGLSTIPSLPSLARAVAATVPLHCRLAVGEPRGKGRALLRGAALGVAWPLGQYLGARAARDGRRWLPTGRI